MGRQVEPSGDRGAVLIVERAVESRRELAWALRSAGFAVVEADHGGQALELIQQRAFDCVLCGSQLDDLTGIDVLRSISAGGAPASLMLMTQEADTRLAVDAMRAGAADLLIQPLPLAVVIERVDVAVRKGRRLRLLEEARRRGMKLAETAEALEEFVPSSPSGSRLRAALPDDDVLCQLEPRQLARLSPRERDITRRLAKGQNISEMALELELSPNTVRNHVKSIFGKLQVRSQVALLSMLVGGRAGQG